jgi:hypothetical protein
MRQGRWLWLFELVWSWRVSGLLLLVVVVVVVLQCLRVVDDSTVGLGLLGALCVAQKAIVCLGLILMGRLSRV